MGAVHVVDTRKTRIKAGYAAKTDRLDAQRLADALRRESVVGIYYPPPAIRELRELCRYRCHLARMQASLKQRIHALLLRQGVAAPRCKRLFTTARHARGSTPSRSPGGPAPSWAGLRAVLADVRARLEPVLATIATTAADRSDRAGVGSRARASGRCSASRCAPKSAPSRRFPDGPHLASYAGLVPRVERSGGPAAGAGRITKTGSPWLRWALIEAAIHQFRRQDDFGRWARQLAVRKGDAEGARRRGARAVRRNVRRLAAAREPLRVDGRRKHGHRVVDL